MKIGILTIMLGKYDIFFETLYNSFDEKFLCEHKKTFYVFTDKNIKSKSNVVKIETKKIGWPYDTLNRFDMFNSIKNQLLQNDFLFFLNANMFCTEQIYDEIIPTKENDYFVGVNHPAFFDKTPDKFTYERNKNSQFFISENEGSTYFQGCFNGGKSEKFLEMSDILSNKIKIDLSKNIMPIWHDESALNWFYSKLNPLVLSPSYSYPEKWSLPFDKKILQLDKQSFGGHNYLRNF